MTLTDVALILASALRLSTPLLLACLAGLYSERAGIFNIGLEGMMLGAAFAAAVTATQTQSAGLGLLAGLIVGVLLALVHAFASITQRGNQIVSGVAINTLAIGLTAVLGNAWYKEGGRTPPLPANVRFQTIELPYAASLRDTPVVGPLYSDLLSGHYIFVYVALLAVPFTAFVLNETRFGLRLRAVGENPAAVDTAGVSVERMRYLALVCCGLLCGLAGTYMSTAQSASFVTEMTAGKGFIALAALIFAKWRPWGALGACLLFGLLDAFAIRLEGATLPLIGQAPVQAIQALPYLLTVVLLAGFIGRAIPPKAGGVPYVKERR
ncbi:ABC transporter permease [Terrarubrum flagellatum]|uniref:ABC transporter permease n=1 Tax=Terrirubrum flagellatum TaxID=2895980 RepID=UPI0031450466